MDRSEIPKLTPVQPDNQKLSTDFIQLLKGYFENKPNSSLQLEVEKLLTNGSGFSVYNLQHGLEVVSAASMFHVLRLIGDNKLTDRFLSLPTALGEPRRKRAVSKPQPLKTSRYMDFD